jgi:hypothetical protein
LDKAAISPVFLAARNMDENSNIQSLMECIYQVYDQESIVYQRKANNENAN